MTKIACRQSEYCCETENAKKNIQIQRREDFYDKKTIFKTESVWEKKNNDS